ncbi:MAG: TraR/DksA family transcriptional regulator, partial [Pseudomonadota bacterium]
MLAALDAFEARGQDERATVTLDQQSVGRLSRMDALQRQAMAQAASRRFEAEKRRIVAALARLDGGEYGYCTECGEEIASARLEVDPCVPSCVS